MCVTLDERIVTVRKSHDCLWCPESIESQMQARYYVGIFEGDFQSWYMHPECWTAFIETANEYYDGGCMGVNPHEQERGKVAA